MTSGIGASRDRAHLENSRPLQWNQKALTDAERGAIDHLIALLETGENRKRKRREDDRARIRATLGALVLDMYREAKADSTRFLSYSRRKEEYGTPDAPPLVTLTTVRTVVAFLEGAGFATTRLGSFMRKNNPFATGQVGSGYLSRIRAEPLLIDLLEGVFGVSLSGIGTEGGGAGSKLLRLKAPAARGVPKRDIRFEETEETAAMRARLMAANSLRASCVFSFDGPEPEGLHMGDVHLYRVFNNGRWDHGGRFYRGWWSMLGKIDRSRILIDGEETVELDFGAIHPRMCFHLLGCPLPPEADPYRLPDLDVTRYRDSVKMAFGQLVSATTDRTPLRPSGTKALFPTPKDYAAFVAKVETAFQPVSAWLRAGRGVELQFIDSQIADAVLAEMTGAGIPCLPIHDSFIVPRSAELDIGVAMYRAYLQVMSQRTEVAGRPAISGWTDPLIEQDALRLVYPTGA